MAFEKAIAKGVALLDEKVPGWLDQINVDALDMDVPILQGSCGCILAQTHLDYFAGLSAIGIRDVNDSVACGFTLGEGNTRESDWSCLTYEWVATITRLRAERGR